MPLQAAAAADEKTLLAARLKLSWKKIVTGKREAELEGLGDRMRLEWVHNSPFRFFPPQRDELVTIHETILPLGAAICAAVRFPMRHILNAERPRSYQSVKVFMIHDFFPIIAFRQFSPQTERWSEMVIGRRAPPLCKGKFHRSFSRGGSLAHVNFRFLSCPRQRSGVAC